MKTRTTTAAVTLAAGMMLAAPSPAHAYDRCSANESFDAYLERSTAAESIQVMTYGKFSLWDTTIRNGEGEWTKITRYGQLAWVLDIESLDYTCD